MPVARDLMRRIRELDEFDLRRLLIFVRGLLVSREGRDPGHVVQGPEGSKITYRQERVRCGRANCTRCPHGPYWYAYWRGGRPPRGGGNRQEGPGRGSGGGRAPWPKGEAGRPL